MPILTKLLLPLELPAVPFTLDILWVWKSLLVHLSKLLLLSSVGKEIRLKDTSDEYPEELLAADN